MDKKGTSLVKIIIPILAIVIIVVLLLFFLKGCKGPGLGPGSGEKGTSAKSSDTTKTNQKSKGEATNYIVEIKESNVYINDNRFVDEKELKDYVESINNDNVKFYFKEDDDSILSTYEMVDKVFKSLGIDLYKSE